MAKITLKLDKRKNCKKSDGTFPVVLSLIHKSKTRPIGLKYSFSLENWDEQKSAPIGIKDAKYIKAKLDDYLMKAQLFLNGLGIEAELWSVQDLKVRVQSEMFSTSSTTEKVKMRFESIRKTSISLTEYGERKINRLRISKKNGNADVIEDSLSSLRRFRKQQNIDFAEVDENFLKDFSAYCYSRNNKASTISVYLRPIRTLFNEAIGEGIISGDLYPFKSFKIPKAAKTKKRALRVSDIETIRELELKPFSAIWKARHYFLFMFNNMGINFIDLVKLKKNQIARAEYNMDGNLINGRITFDRTKTKNAFSIKLTSESIEILNDFNIADKLQDDFVFPFCYEESQKGRDRYKQQRKRVNRKLREIAKLSNITEDITTYYARHSWATIAKRKMIPVTMISEALGHSDLKTTQIYLDSFDNEDLDAANESIVG